MNFVSPGSFGCDTSSGQTFLGRTATPMQDRNQHAACPAPTNEMRGGGPVSEPSSLPSKDSSSQIEPCLPYHPEPLPEHLLGQIHSALTKNPKWCNLETLPFAVHSPAQHSESAATWGKEKSTHIVKSHLSGLMMREKWIFVRWIEAFDEVTGERRFYIIKHRSSPGGWSTWSIWYFGMNEERIELDPFGFEKQGSIYKTMNQSNDAAGNEKDASCSNGKVKSSRLKRPKGRHHPQSLLSSRKRPYSISTTSEPTTEGQNTNPIDIEMTSTAACEHALAKEKGKQPESRSLGLHGMGITQSRQPSNASQSMGEETGSEENMSSPIRPETSTSGYLPHAHAGTAQPKVAEDAHPGPFLDFRAPSVTTPATQMMIVGPIPQGRQTQTRIEADSNGSSVRTGQKILFSLKTWNESPPNRRPRSAESCSTVERLREHAEAGGVFTKTEVNAKDKTLWLELKNGSDGSFPWCFRWRADEDAEEAHAREMEFQDMLEYCRSLIAADPSRLCDFEVSREIAS